MYIPTFALSKLFRFALAALEIERSCRYFPSNLYAGSKKLALDSVCASMGSF